MLLRLVVRVLSPLAVLGLFVFVATSVVMTWVSFRREMGDPAVVAAASNGDAAKVRMLLTHGSPANSYHLEGSSVLWWAVASGSLETVQVLLEYGADPNSRGQWNSVIEQAVEGLDDDDGKPRSAIVHLLLSRAAQVKDPKQVKLLKDGVARKPVVPGKEARAVWKDRK